MPLELHPPLLPMEAHSADRIPEDPGWQYEPKWDGFRCLAFRDGASLELISKAGQPLTRYFPEMAAALLALRPQAFVLDGEIVIPEANAFSFDALLQRIHPAASRVQKLARETPALFIAFDLLADETGASLLKEPLHRRRAKLEKFAAKYLGENRGQVRLSPATGELRDAKDWLAAVGATLDGIIAKRCDAPYGQGERKNMLKIKSHRSADCVIGGFRYAKEQSKGVGSLLVGLYNEEGLLDHVGFSSSFKAPERLQLLPKLKPLIQPPGFSGKAPGGPSRWNNGEEKEWHPLKPELVVEVSYDHFTGGRFRHGTKVLRWRPDKAPRQCTMEQVAQKGADLQRLFAHV